MPNRLFILFFTFAVTLHCNAQLKTVVKGSLKNTSGDPIPQANLLVYSPNSDSTLLSYVSTDAKGEYVLKVDDKGFAFKVVLKALGYKSTVDYIKPDHSATVIKNYVLEVELVQLREVIVKASQPVKVKKDTTSYSSQAFTDGAERSVEDILKKLPGVKVSENGNITVKGKPIDKLMIDGEDFFSKNYKLISRNMSADLVETIQAIENYNENPILRTIEESGKVVINLTIKKDRRKAFFGNTSLQAGTASRYEGRISAFSILKKVSIGLIANANNIGNDPIADTDFRLTDNKDNLLSSERESIKPFVNLRMAELSGIESRRYTFNQSGMVGINANYNVSEKLKIKAFGYIHKDRVLFNTINQTNFTINNYRLNIYDSLYTVAKPSLASGQVKADYNSKNASINCILEFKNSTNSDNFLTNSKDPQLAEQITGTYYAPVKSIRSYIKFSQRINASKALIVDAEFSQNRLPERFSVYSKRYAYYLNVDSTYNLLGQDNDQYASSLKSSIALKGRNKNFTYTVGSTFINRTETLNSQIHLKGKDKQSIPLDSAFLNDLTYERNIASIDLSASWQLSKLRLFSIANLQSINLNKTGELHTVNRLFSPNLTTGLRFDITNEHKLYAVYSQISTLPILNNITNDYVAHNYRTFSKGSTVYGLVSSKVLMMNYIHINWADMLNVFGNLSASSIDNPYVLNFQVDNLINFTNDVYFSGRMNTVSATIQVDKFLSKLSSNIRLGADISESDQFNFIDSKPSAYDKLRTFNVELRLVKSLFENFQVEVGGAYSRTSLINNKSDNERIDVNIIKPKLIMKYRFSDRFHTKLVGEMIRWEYNINTTNALLLDASVHYVPHKSCFTFDLSCNNLADNTLITQSLVNNYAITNRYYYLQPRYVSLQVEWRF